MPGSRRTWSVGRAADAIMNPAIAFVVAALALLPGGALAAAPGTEVRPPGIETLDYQLQDAANYQMLVTNWGMLGSQPGTARPYATQPSLRWPATSSTEYLWSAGLWVGAETGSGPHVSTGQYETEFRPSDSTTAHLYATQEGALGGHRAPALDADDDHDGRVDEDRLNGLDDDGDGLVDEDFAGIADQMYFCEYEDGPSARYLDHVPLGLRIEQTTLAWADSSVDDIVGIDYALVNTAAETSAPLLDVHAGLFADCDIGVSGAPQISEDDRAGFWEGDVTTQFDGAPHTVKVSIGYMFDADGDGGVTPGWIGFVVLGGTRPQSADPALPPVGLVNFRYFSGFSSYATGGDPTNDVERYEILHALGPFPLPPADPITGMRPPQLAPVAQDYRLVISAGSLGSLAPGETAHVQMAIVLGAGFDAMAQNAARAILLYENDWRPGPSVAVAVHDLATSATNASVRLTWQIGAGDVGMLHGVRVQRAASPAGPYADVTEAPLAAAAAMSCEDHGVAPGSTYWYRLLLQTASEVTVHGPVRVDVPASAAWSTVLGAPLQQADGSVRFAYTLAQSGQVTLDIFDVRGLRVRSLARGQSDAGEHRCCWDRRDERGRLVPRGVYFVRLTSAGPPVSAKLLIAHD